MRKRKSGFLTFCFSLLPGAGEMYLGFMKMGISLMGLFFGVIAISATLNIDLTLFVLPILWFYSFFHVHNLSGLSDQDFALVQDEFLFNLDKIASIDRKSIEKYRKVIAAVLILVGAALLWNGFIDTCYNFLSESVVRFLHRIGYTLPRMVVGVAIIIGGFYMIKGKKKQMDMVDTQAAKEVTPKEVVDVPQENSQQ